MKTKKIALITGASSGIGKELAYIHAKNGGDLILIARRTSELKEIKATLEEMYNINVMCISKDLSLVGSAKEIYDEIKASNIQIDYLINNAGFGQIGKFYELSWLRQFQMINLNITALVELTYFFLHDFINRNEGKILNISSTASFVPGPLQAVYYATKAFVTSFSNALAEELYNTNITVTNLLPGATNTEFGTISGMDKTQVFKKAVHPNIVAKDGYEAMLDGKLDVISGLTNSQKLFVLARFLIPKKIILKNIRQMQEITTNNIVYKP